MKKIIAVLSICLFASCIHSFAQFKLLAESKKFSELSGDSYILQMKNGNTVLVNSARDGINLRIYDGQRAEKAMNSFNPSSTLKSFTIDNVFEVGGDVVLFISSYEGNAPLLNRFIIDGNMGKLKEEKVLVRTPGTGGMLNTGRVNAFHVKKDPVNENYVVSVYYMFEDNKDKRLEIIQFDDKHTELSRNFLVTGNDDEYKFFVYMDMTVLDANRVNVFLYNGKEKYFSNTKKGRMMMASVNRKNSNVTYTPIDLPEGIKYEDCKAVYNPVLKKILMIVAEPRKKDNPISQYFVKINPESNKIEVKPFFSISDELNKKYRDKYSVKENYTGSLGRFYVNDDGTSTAVYEESFVYSYSGYSTSYTSNILVANYSANGDVLTSHVIPKLYVMEGYSPYKRYLYVEGKKNKYMCIDDTERNNDVKKNKFVEIKGVSELDAFYYTLDPAENFPKRDYVFGDSKDGHELLAFDIYSYNKASNTLVTLRLSKKTAADRDVSLVWLQPE